MADPEKMSPPAYDGWHLDSDWRGLTPKRDEVTYNPQKLANLAKAITEDLKKFAGDSPGSFADLKAHTDLSALPGLDSLPTSLKDAKIVSLVSAMKEIKRWNGGHAFAETLEAAHKQFTDAYQQIQEKAMIAAALIQAGAGKYDSTDQANNAGSKLI